MTHLKRFAFIYCLTIAISCQTTPSVEAQKDNLVSNYDFSDTAETIVVDKINNAHKNKNYFFFNCYYGMPEKDFYDSISKNPTYTFGYSGDPSTIDLTVGKEPIKLIPSPIYYSTYLTGIDFVVKTYDTDIATDMSEFDLLDAKAYFFSLPHIPNSFVQELLGLYTEKYGAPVIKKGDIYETSLRPNLKRYLDFQMQFESIENNTSENVRGRLESEAMRSLEGILEKNQETLYTFPVINGNSITMRVVYRLNVLGIKYKQENSKTKAIVIKYIPKEETEISLERDNFNKQTERSYQEENDRKKKEAVNKTKKAI
jgi:hypothetical protein